MNIEIKKPADIKSGLVFGTTADGSIVVRGDCRAITLKGSTTFSTGSCWVQNGSPADLTPFPPGTVITITV